ncbi:MAG: sulfatase-like hydrolase/transferase [Verrucomicrobia bacterium]|nr:sulfatase-like hydrolase/transferase [Verrucomicrobiota bacterium]
MKKVLCTLLLSALAHGTPAASRPNVIFLFSDDAGYADFGLQNALSGAITEFLTPNLDQLALEGRVCTQAYVAAPVCSPSRAGLLSGRNQQRFGYEYNISNDNVFNDGMPLTEKILTERMGELGYTVGVVGKWHIGREAAKRPINRGVDYFFGLWSGSRPYFGIETDNEKKIRDINDTHLMWNTLPSFNSIAPDPMLGRHLTDAFGDAACEFIDTHADDAEPFFLYVPFTSPHGPHDLAKASDLALFSGASLTADGKNSAALTHAMDRAVGYILDCLDAHSIATNTIVFFTNDNGGPIDADAAHRNTPLRGGKSSSYEGGLRVPFIVRLPNPDNPGQYCSGVYTNPVTTYDIYPTFVEAAGGTVNKQTDGVNLVPYLTGQNTNAPHGLLPWRMGSNWAIREGSWKLVHSGSDGIRLSLLQDNGKGEWVDKSAIEPAIRQDLLEKFTAWETQLDKPRHSTSNPANRFDAFRFRQGVGTSMDWSDSNGWKNAATGTEITMMTADAYANLSIEFQPKDQYSYVANNDLTRISELTFMLNELKFAGSFDGTVDLTGTLAGNPLLFVNDLNGNAPAINLGSYTTSASSFIFNIDTDLILYNDLEITGNSTLGYVINGNISAYTEPCSITKTGTATLALTGINTYGGATSIQGGTLRIANSLQTAQLQVVDAATFEMDLDDTILVDGTATLGGMLAVNPGTSTHAILIAADAIAGTFHSTSLPPPPPGQHWRLEYSPTNVVLRAGATADTDGDKLSDDWEIAQFGNLTTSRGGNDNFDGDRSSDLVEYLAGTSATNPASYFQTVLTEVGFGTIEVEFDGISNRTYILETSETLSNAWNFGESVGPLPTNGPQTLRHTVPGDPASLFGRIGISEQ